MKINKLIIAGLTMVSLVSCEDYLSVKDTSTVTADKYQEIVAKNPEVLGSTLSGTYLYLASWNSLGGGDHDDINLMGTLHATDLMSEDMVQTVSHWFTYDYTHDNRMENYRRPLSIWKTFYTTISQANGVIAAIDQDAVKTPGSKLRPYYGQALALRAFSYMYLVQLFQNPFIGSPDASGAKIDRSLPAVPMYFAKNEVGKETNYSRNTVGDVLDMIKSDLDEADEMLSGWNRAENKMNIDQSVVRGLLARYYLMIGDWEKAASSAVLARSGYPLMNKKELESGFMTLSTPEWMWGFDHNSETNTMYASFFSHISNLTPGYAGLNYAPRAIDRRLYDNIPATDYRKGLFNGSAKNTEQANAGAQGPYANLKFGWDGSWTMDYVYMRASEMYLIEAEALARQNKMTDAATALKPFMALRDTAWHNTTITVDEVLFQRRIELWGEGFAYFDLKRLHKGIDRTYEGTNHRTPDGLLKITASDVRWTYQIPLSEIQKIQPQEDDNNK
ncbi:MAG: RagB/SusD family nutrient uptake outer membrane protein [Prevotellaceae bacterium]|nr:RagB/SusD family nutrient uptake outer membrane protein [Prevotellaceae bacterium]